VGNPMNLSMVISVYASISRELGLPLRFPGTQLPKYVSAAFGSLALPWKPGHLRSAYAAM
jgi:hypothetical protein